MVVVMKTQPPEGVALWCITGLECWLCGINFWFRASDSALFPSVNVGSEHSPFEGFWGVNCWPLVDLRQLHEPPQICDRCKWSRELMEDWQITAVRDWTANIGKISFYSMVRIQSGICQWLEFGLWRRHHGQKSFGSKKLSVGLRIWVCDMRTPGRWSHTLVKNTGISITTFSSPPNIDRMCWKNSEECW